MCFGFSSISSITPTFASLGTGTLGGSFVAHPWINTVMNIIAIILFITLLLSAMYRKTDVAR
jgi:hypothetical protein